MKIDSGNSRRDHQPLLISIILLSAFTFIFQKADAQSNPLLAIDKSKHYFLDSNNKPLFWQGDTAWELFHLFSPAEANALLSERKRQGFNVIQIMAAGVFPEWGARMGIDFKSWEEAWINRDPSKPNEKYFERVDSIVSVAASLDMILAVGVFHAQDIEKGRINIQNVRPWARWIASRYKNSSNIIWSMYPHADSLSAPFIDEAVLGIREGDGGSHLITMHPDPSPKSSSFMHNSSWLSFNTLQTWSNEVINHEMVIADYEKNPVKPVVNGEARYEAEDGTTAVQVRKAGYWSYMAGGFYSYGHQDNWKSPLTWRKWFNSDGANQMKIMGDFFRSIPWWKLVPDQSLFANGSHGDVAAISADGEWLLAYLTAGKNVTIKLDRLKAKQIEVSWINPLNGLRSKKTMYSTSKQQTFTPPQDWEDALLFIERIK